MNPKAKHPAGTRAKQLFGGIVQTFLDSDRAASLYELVVPSGALCHRDEHKDDNAHCAHVRLVLLRLRAGSQQHTPLKLLALAEALMGALDCSSTAYWLGQWLYTFACLVDMCAVDMQMPENALASAPVLTGQKRQEYVDNYVKAACIL